MNKKILLLGLFMVQFVYASQYNYTIVKSFSDNIDMGDDSLGTVVLLPVIIDKETFVLNYNNNSNCSFNNITINKTDSIQLNSSHSNSILIDSQLVTPGNSKAMDTAGEFIFYEVSYPNCTGKVIVNDISYPIISITKDSNNLIDTIISDSSFTLSTEKQITIDTDADSDLLTSTPYTLKFYINENIIESIININPYYNWSLISQSFINTMDSGSNGQFGNITLKNIGNTFMTVNIERTGLLKDMIFSPTSALLYPNIENSIPILYDIDEGVNISNSYDIAFTITGQGVTRLINLTNISIKDDIYPEFKEFEIENISINRDSFFTIQYWDNQIRLKNITSELVHKRTDKIIPVEFIREGDGKYRARFKLLDIGDYIIKVCLIDQSDNTNCSEKNFSVKPLDIIKYEPTIRFLNSKINTFANEKRLLDITRDESIIIMLNSISYNGSYDIKITSGEIDYFIKTVGEKITVKANDSLSIAFKGDVYGSFNGELSFIVPDYHIPITPITFNGGLVNYTVPTAFVKEWYDSNMSCMPYDTGNPETSYMQCEIRYPFTTTLETAAIPLTIEQKEEFEKNNIDEIERLKKSKRNMVILIIVIIFICLGMVGYSFYMSTIYPRFLPKWR